MDPEDPAFRGYHQKGSELAKATGAVGGNRKAAAAAATGAQLAAARAAAHAAAVARRAAVPPHKEVAALSEEAASSDDEYSSVAEALRREPLAIAEAFRLRAASPLRFEALRPRAASPLRFKTDRDFRSFFDVEELRDVRGRRAASPLPDGRARFEIHPHSRVWNTPLYALPLERCSVQPPPRPSASAAALPRAESPLTVLRRKLGTARRANVARVAFDAFEPPSIDVDVAVRLFVCVNCKEPVDNRCLPCSSRAFDEQVDVLCNACVRGCDARLESASQPCAA